MPRNKTSAQRFGGSSSLMKRSRCQSVEPPRRCSVLVDDTLADSSIRGISAGTQRGLGRRGEEDRAASFIRPGPVPAVPCARTPGRGRKRCEPRSVPAPPTGQARPASPHVGRHTTEPSPNTSCSPSTSRDLWPRSKSRGLNPRRAAVSGSIPASHSRRCTSIVAFGISALPPT